MGGLGATEFALLELSRDQNSTRIQIVVSRHIRTRLMRTLADERLAAPPAKEHYLNNCRKKAEYHPPSTTWFSFPKVSPASVLWVCF